jgi:acetyltransferase
VAKDAESISFHGRQVCLRPLEAQDRPLLEDLAGRTELGDLRMRFFSGFHTLPPDVLDQLMLIDPQRRITLVAGSTASNGKPEILAVARAHLVTEGSAELALLVRSDLKGMGLGSLMLDRLIALCRSRGISLLVAEVLHDNTRMLRLADRYGFRQETAQPGTTRLVLDLDLRAP